ncbi:RNA recognition motif domain protein [Kalmanozyma brasiliensis GHG001]|uniref:RRM domain-containing protein n=1 Tax=Kalmanozyma brasiliensis (strain GHG001) TaxID=1365824 RepID=V5GKG3_KALBG|nr:RNA recognition motif domain protein [Kalmanozyma brasiliensis GHG001]EST06452.1 RNA recognition motif domain protein [Kalmanozyma brasiliensis GHG001]
MPPKRYFEQDEPVTEAAVAASSSEAATATASTSTDSATKNKAPKTKVNATLFVSRLPYTATTTDLQTMFSEIGPLKRAFVVTDQATKKSKGVGYVTFAIPEDATTALEQLQGKSLDGGSRKLQITFADQKDPTGAKRPPVKADPNSPSSTKRPRTETSKPARTNGPVQEKDADAVRTVILSGLAGCSPAPDSKQIYKRARKIGDVENVIYPSTSSSNPNDVAHVIFRTPNHAMTAVEKLHAHVFKGVQISAILKKRADNAAKIAAHMRPETLAKREKMRQDVEKNSGRGTMPVLLSEIDKSSRLIIRNLPYDVNEADLRSIFLPFGPVYEITIPKVKAKDAGAKDAVTTKEEDASEDAIDIDESASDASDDDEDGSEADDDAEVEDDEDVESDADSESDAEAIEQSSEASEDAASDDAASSYDGEADATPTTEDIVVKTEEDDSVPALTSTPLPAATPTTSKPAIEKGRGFAFVWMVSRNDAARAIEAVNGKPIQHGAAERAAYKSALGSRGRRAAKSALDRVRAAAQPERTVAVDWALSKKDWEAKADESEPEDSPDAAGSDDEDEPAERPQLPAPEEGTTLFIRNLPYQATEEELRNLFRTFGPLRYAKITMDRTTNRSKGTGFVCFWQATSAEAALAQAAIIERESGTGTTVANQKNPFAMPSVLTADPAAPMTASLNLHGRVLNVIPAVDRSEATRLETSGRKEREKGDKRNTWLLREGVPFPNSDFAAKFAPSETEKRLQSFQVRKAQLGANPSLFVSKTRLSVRSLPLFVSDRMLKRLAVHAVKAFGAEVRAKEREDLDADEKADRTLSAAGENRKRKPGERPTAVVQSKVVRQHDRVEALTGLGKSKGYGFLEMKSYHDALKVIRWANANKGVSKLFGTWWVDELSQQVDRIATQIHAKNKLLEEKKGDEAEMLRKEVEELTTRRQRLRAKLAELGEDGAGGEKERGGMLMIEFAIENVVTTKKRADKLKAVKESTERRKLREVEDEKVREREIELERREKQAAVKIEADKNKPRGFAHGHVIGKKRKERKARRG